MSGTTLTEDQIALINLCPKLCYVYCPSGRDYDRRWVFQERGEVRGERAAFDLAVQEWWKLIDKMASNDELASRMQQALMNAGVRKERR